MTNFTISEDFPINEIAFDKRFSNPKTCYHLQKHRCWSILSLRAQRGSLYESKSLKS